MDLSLRIVACLLVVCCTLLPMPSVSGENLAGPSRAGKVADLQGMVSVRSEGHRRWTAAVEKLAILPGDQVRTGVRGANAVLVELSGGGTVTLGPGSRAQVIDAGSLRLLAGEAEVVPPEKGKLTVFGPGKVAESVDSARVFRAAKGEFVTCWGRQRNRSCRVVMMKETSLSVAIRRRKV